MAPRGETGVEDGYDNNDNNDDVEGQETLTRNRPWFTARTVVGAFSIMVSLTLLGLAIKMSIAYDEAPLIHVSVAFVGFTAATSMAWQSFEFIAMCVRRGRRGIYPGVHVGVYISLCLATVATTGYVCFWVSAGDRWKDVQVHGHKTAYSPLYHIGIVVVILTSVLLLLHFILSILACQEIRRKADDGPQRAVVTVRYDGVGPLGTERPLSYRVSESIGLPTYTNGEPAGPIVIARGGWGQDIKDSHSSGKSIIPEKTGLPRQAA